MFIRLGCRRGDLRVPPACARGIAVAQGHELIDLFRAHVESGVWNLLALTESLMRKIAMVIRTLPPEVPLRAGDAIHIATAIKASEPEIWTNDRHLLSAVAHFGIAGRVARLSK